MTNEIFRPNGNGYDVTPPGVLLIVAGLFYGHAESTPLGRRKAGELMEGILSAALAGGFCQGDILHTLLARNQATPQLGAMVQAACDAAGPAPLREIFKKAGLA